MKDRLEAIIDKAIAEADDNFGMPNSSQMTEIMLEEGEWILVAPRRTGRNATFKCSVCGKKVSSYYNDVGEWKCCPHCESKMKGSTK